MKNLMLVVIFISLSFSQVLEIDSIVDPGQWTDPESIFVSDDLYGVPNGNQDILILSIADPIDTVDVTLDSVKVYLEQHVSDTTKGFWYVVSITNGIPGTATPQQAGTFIDSFLCFDISVDITGWIDLIGLHIELHPKKGTAAPPQWYADYLYVYTYTTTGIFEKEYKVKKDNLKLLMPTIAHNEITFICNLNVPANITIEIYNTTGKKELGKEINGTAGTNTITLKEIRTFAAGVYYLRVKSINQKGVQKVTSGKFVVLD
ncbi:T9SS type A sorting domain-containing protein [candidate division WOR-3 bacterium]|nr:T9SS type A sorting domain-containing protein [candidate division WOR-3 bacterium]